MAHSWAVKYQGSPQFFIFWYKQISAPDGPSLEPTQHGEGGMR